MKCNECNFDNEDKSLFCGACGVKLLQVVKANKEEVTSYSFETRKNYVIFFLIILTLYLLFGNPSLNKTEIDNKIYTSYDTRGCPVYKNADGKVLQKSTLLRQKDGC